MSKWNSETAEWYAKNYGDYPTNRLGVKELNPSEDATIVDIGCGTGSALRHAASMIKAGTFIGIDPTSRMIEIANELTEGHKDRARIEFRFGSAEKMPVDDDFATYVLAFDSIDHWQDVAQGLSEVRRIIQSDGVLAIVKDTSTPGAKKAIQSLTRHLTATGFEIMESREVSREDVSFYFLTCRIKAMHPRNPTTNIVGH